MNRLPAAPSRWPPRPSDWPFPRVFDLVTRTVDGTVSTPSPLFGRSDGRRVVGVAQGEETTVLELGPARTGVDRSV